MTVDFQEAVRDEAALRSALADADIAPMLMVLVQLTGDLDILEEVAPHIHGAWSFLEAVPEPLKQKVRDRLVAALKAQATTGRPPPPLPPPDMLQRMMSAGVGQTVPEEYIPLLVEETRLGAEDPRRVRWQRDPATLPLRDFKVVVIGAGFAGLCTGIRLKEMGIPFEILEKNDAVGGTWLENDYPGCAVDTPNHFFSFSFNPNPGWSRHFSGRDEIRAYIESGFDKYGVRQHVRLGAEVTGAESTRPLRAGASHSAGAIAGRRPSSATPSSPRSASSTSPPFRRSRDCPASVARPSTRRAGTAAWTSGASGWRWSARARARCRPAPPSRRK
ncbi:NAD(P)-binding protein [Siccirubricoccus sp. G192]|uniref:NAD(P)-binding protein n=1 Tax=Siccirubricoccus sp. G192 TaxID=2849651 RepID=UPI001C2C1B97|nr:NAD(P)-binding protein [Siccirubricoccus sp. G192]MBV1796848.1 NAD(P)-binding protein [Siccirubricoccus sp. G192]